MVPRRSRFRAQAHLDLLFALREDELEFLALGRDGEPAGAAWQLVVRALLESECSRIELQRSLLVAHNDGHVRQFLDHGCLLQTLYNILVI